ncbi:hypothetical protein [Methylotuvimicrobium buryatense]|uniref:hypothetical protein n=1 Tax=Methylotuvimicrobium buryatense TaxID=95641 RepID=UPI00034D3708|nr:hypothetical protein [Methylotuvimicrobium buryatense]
MYQKINIFSSIFNWLTSNDERRIKNKNPDLYVLKDTDIEKELKIRSEAERLGNSGLPSPDAVQLTGIEEQIIHRIDRARLDYLDWANTRLQVLNEDLSRLDIQPIVKNTLQLDQEFSREASSLLDDSEPFIKSLLNRFEKTKTELDNFKINNDLTRDAHYPTKWHLFFKFSFFIFLILVEGLANSFFFAQGVDSGLIGGFFMAMMFSGFNVITAGLQGRFVIPFLFHNNWPVKFLGFFLSLLGVVLTVCIALGISHYRDALGMDKVEPAYSAFLALKANPLDLHDIMSWALFGISLLFAVFALIDGISMSDHYPFYASKTKRYIEAKEEYETEFHDLREELNELKARFLKKLNENSNEIKSTLEKQKSVIERKHTSEKRLQTAIQDADQCMRSLLGIFRQENMIHRKGLPVPKTFNKVPSPKSLNIPNFHLDKDWVNFEKQKFAADEVVLKLEDIKASIQASFNREFDRLQPLGLHINSQ